MMREILFRGKRIDSGEWVCWNEYGELTEIIYFQNEKWKSLHYEASKKIVDPATVGQYTGLEDKNGAKIFEGDIVKTKFFGKDSEGTNFNDFDIFEVAFFEGKFYTKNNTRRFCVRVESAPIYEIIGNIHDNPELLEAGQ